MPQALERLRAMRQAQAAAEPTDLSPKSPRTSGMTLAQFAGSGRALRIYSDVLGEEVIFAADNARLAPEEARPVYRARELAVIWSEDGSISADGLRLLHEVKVRFAAEVTSDISNQTIERPEA